MKPEPQLIGLADIQDAQKVIADRLHRTPMMTSSTLSAQTGLDLSLKLELFQKTGSFKPRGVLNNLHHLSPEARQAGVISLSAGNHAQALAWAATQVGAPSTLVMPAGAIRSKIEATRGYGGEVVLTEGDLLATCLQIQQERGLTLVHPFDDLKTIAGQGTLGLEVMEDASGTDAVLVGVGGGGLISGVAAAVKARKPEARVIGVEPEGAAVMTRSLREGAPVHVDQLDTIADGLAAPFVGVRNLLHVQAYVDEMVVVPDEAIVDAMKMLMERCKVVAEPAGAAPLAALLCRAARLPAGGRTVCVVSGGNVDLERLKLLL